jgi:signal peptidase I
MTNESQFVGIRAEDDQDIRIVSDLLAPHTQAEESKSFWAEARSLLRDVFIAILIATFIVFFLVRPVRVEGESMKPKLNDRDRIFVNQIVYPMREWFGDKQPIKRGDIVVLYYPRDPSKSYIKRVIGLPGEDVTIEGGKLYINGVLQSESYLPPEAINEYHRPPTNEHVDEHHYFVMGDNRNYSSDSRDWKLVPEKYIYGKAMFRYYSPQNWLASIGTLE